MHSQNCDESMPSSITYIVRAERRKRSLDEDQKWTQGEVACSKFENIAEQSDENSEELPLFFRSGRFLDESVVHCLEKTMSASWREVLRKDKIKTVGVGLIICLNIGVTPPDATEKGPHEEIVEGWTKLTWMERPETGVEAVAKQLQMQYQQYQPRAHFRNGLDPNITVVRKICRVLRKNAKHDRLLFHYNGHGVPNPTVNGEIWLFDEKYTEYVPLSLHDILRWIQGPTIFVYDCNSAAIAVEKLNTFRSRLVSEYEQRQLLDPTLPSLSGVNDIIQLAACGKNQRLPAASNLPADLFTSCLTTPVKAALRWFVTSQNALLPHITVTMVDEIPGDLKNRHTPLGELNWIFVSITDTIAWLMLRDEPLTFQKLFREDVLVASMMRNYLLAERVMNSFGIQPVTSPELPACRYHRLWDLWDFVVDACVGQLPYIDGKQENYTRSTYFKDQLTALEIWLNSPQRRVSPPDELPVLLQTMLSLDYRSHALILLDRFLALGYWSVRAALDVGFFPVLLKLLKAQSSEPVHPIIVSIWAKIISYDRMCRNDLVSEESESYFIDILQDHTLPTTFSTSAAYVLANLMYEYPEGQSACFQQQLLCICMDRISSSDPLLRQWCVICMALLWTRNKLIGGSAMRNRVPEQLLALVDDPIPLVRGASVFALGSLIACQNTRETTRHCGAAYSNDDLLPSVTSIIATKLSSMDDGSPAVRRELLVALYGVLTHSEKGFLSSLMNLHDVYRQTSRRSSMMDDSCSDGMPPEDRNKDNNSSWGKIRNVLGINSSSKMPGRESKQNSRRSSQDSNDAASVRQSVQLLYDSTDEYEPDFNLIINSLTQSEQHRKVQSCPCNGEYSESCEYLKSNSRNFLLFPQNQENMYTKAYDAILKLTQDPLFEIRDMANNVVSYVNSKFISCLNTPQRKRTVSERYSRKPITSICEWGEGEDISTTSHPSESKCPEHGLHTTVKDPDYEEPGDSLTSVAQLPKDDQSVSNNAIAGSNNAIAASYDKEGPTQVIATSTFFNRCVQNFGDEVLFKRTTVDRKEEEIKEWRSLRNVTIKKSAEKRILNEPGFRFEHEVLLQKNLASPTVLKFDPFQPHLAVADNEVISVWNYKTRTKLNCFRNGNASDFKISSIYHVNENDIPLLLVASDDGNVRVWKNYEDGDMEEMVSAWNIITPMQYHQSWCLDRSSSMVTEWEQQSGTLFASGIADFIRLWDVERETCSQDVPMKQQQTVTSIKGNSMMSPHLFVAGTCEGYLELFDRRLSGDRMHVIRMHEHTHSICNVFLREREEKTIVSACAEGCVKFWDVRMTSSVSTIWNHKPDTAHTHVTCAALHDKADLIALGSADNGVKVVKSEGKMLSELTQNGGIMGQRIGHVSCLSFHPYWTYVVLGTTDGFVCAYSAHKLVRLEKYECCSHDGNSSIDE